MKTSDHTRNEQFTKQVVVFTLCGIAFVFVATLCVLALRQLTIPDAIDRNAAGALGILGGMLIKTGVDAWQKSKADEEK